MQLNAPQTALRWHILIGMYQLVNDIVRVRSAEVMPASVFAALYSRAPVQNSTSGTECHTVLVGS